MRTWLVLAVLAATVVVGKAQSAPMVRPRLTAPPGMSASEATAPPAATAPAAAPAGASPPAASPTEELQVLKERIRALEQEVARLRASVPVDGKTGIVYGPTSRSNEPMPRYTSQAKVLAERGVPTRTEWTSKGRVLYYGRERWSFDENGQLTGVQRDQ